MPDGSFAWLEKPGHRRRSHADYEHARLAWCELCGQVATAHRRIVPHHFKTRGAGGGDDAANLISLCELLDGNGCHQLVHRGRISRHRLEQVIAQRKQGRT